MMMNRDKLGFWARLIAVLLALVFILSFVFLGIGGNVSYNLFDLIGGQNNQQAEQGQNNVEQQVQAAEANLEENPEDPEAIRSAGATYFQASRLDEAERVLERGREVAPQDAEMALLLGQVYDQRASTAEEGNRQEAYARAAEEYVAASEIDQEEPISYVLAGQAYEQADDPGRAIQNYNEYLDREPEGEYAETARQQVDTLLNEGNEGGEGAQEGQSGDGG